MRDFVISPAGGSYIFRRRRLSRYAHTAPANPPIKPAHTDILMSGLIELNSKKISVAVTQYPMINPASTSRVRPPFGWAR